MNVWMLSVRSPFPDFCWPRVWQWIQPFRHHLSDDFSPQTLDEFVAASLARSEHAQTWGVWRGEELGGLILIEHVNPVLVQSHVIFKRTFWGRATTAAAISQVYETVFASGVQKIASAVFASNHAILALAKSLGAKQEGTLIAHTRRNGVAVDMIALGLHKEDFDAFRHSGSDAADIGNRDGRFAHRRTDEQEQGADINVNSDVHSRTDANPEHAGG